MRRDLERLLSHVVSGRTIAAHEDVISASRGNSAANFGGVAPDNLGVMAHVRPVSGSADIRKDARFVVFLLSAPAIDHGLLAEVARAAHPEVFTFAAAGTVLEGFTTACGEIVGPALSITC